MPSSRDLFESGVLLCFLLAFISLVSEGQFAALYGKNGLVPLKQLNDEGLLFSSISSSDNVDSRARSTLKFIRGYLMTYSFSNSRT